MSETWALYIDEEGFSEHWNDTNMEAFRGLNALIEAIFRIGVHVYPRDNKQLRCHQFGDGFLIASNTNEDDLTRSALIAIAILRHVLANGRVARACLAEGNVSGIVGLYPKEVRDARVKCNGYPFTLDEVPLGDEGGILTLTPVMGKGLIKTYGLSKHKPKGPLFLADATLRDRLPRDIINGTVGEVALINWLKGEPFGLREIQESAGLKIESEVERISRLKQYINNNQTLSEAWKCGAYTYLFE